MIDKTKPEPLYSQLKNIILDKIKNGTFEPNGIIPSETEIQKRYNISRITVRRAVTELAKEGYLDKKPGVGTFVAQPSKKGQIVQGLDSISTWTQTMLEKGITPGTARIEISEVIPPSDVSIALKIDFNQKVTKIKRWRTGDDKPFCIMTNYLLSRLVPDIVEMGLNQESLYKVLEDRYGIEFDIAREVVGARGATEEESDFLGVGVDTPILEVTRISYDPLGVPFEVTKQATRADLYRYRVTLKGR